MSTPETLSYEAVINAVRQWSPDERLALVQEILTLQPEGPRVRRRRKTLKQALGLLATGQPAPSDTDVQQWLDEQRMTKYARPA